MDAIAIATFGLRVTTGSEFALRMISHGLIGSLVEGELPGVGKCVQGRSLRVARRIRARASKA